MLQSDYDASKPDQARSAILGSKLSINPEQARWVKWIFEHYADGWSPLKIVNELNRKAIPPPGAAYRRTSTRRPLSWCASALHGDLNQGTGLLNNPLYIGQSIWNGSRWEKDPDTKRKKRFLRDRSEWVVTPAPQLRIVSDDLWERVKARQREITHNSGPKYLFSGLLVCGVCGGKYVITDPTRYGCSTWLYRGESVCHNTVKVSRRLVETLLLESIQRDLFTEDALALFKQETARLLAERRQAQTPDLVHAKARLAQVEQQIAHMLTAIKEGFRSDTLKKDLEEAERERARLQATMHGQSKKLDKMVDFLPNAMARFKALVEDLATVTQHQVDKAHGILRELVGRQIPLHPTANGTESYLTAELSGDYAGLIRLVLGQNKFGGGQGI